MSLENKNEIYDVIIIGGGPAGYTAALYCTRAGIETLVIEKLSAGGQMCQASLIDNYPGFEEGIDGFTLGFKMQQSAERFGAKTKRAEVLSVKLDGHIKEVHTDEGILLAHSVIIATGAGHRHLGIDKEIDLIGKGVGYCATCDGMFYKGKTVAVVGGGNSAVIAALFLSKICEKVTLVHRGDKFRAEKVYSIPLMNKSNVEIIWNSTVSELLHEEKLTGIKVKEKQTEKETEIPCDGLFINIGIVPSTELFKEQINLDDAGYIVADESTRTNVEGVFAVGDVRTKSVRQIITAAADGAVASHYVEKYLAEHI